MHYYACTCMIMYVYMKIIASALRPNQSRYISTELPPVRSAMFSFSIMIVTP